MAGRRRRRKRLGTSLAVSRQKPVSSIFFRLLAVLEDRKKDTVKAFFSSIPNRLRKTVRVVCSDLYDGFMNAAHEVFGQQVQIVADREVAILVEAISVVIKRSAIDQKFPGGAVLAPVGAELSHDHALGRGLQDQGEQDALDVRPLREDQPLACATDRLDWPVFVVVPRMAKPVQARFHLASDLAVPSGEAIAEQLKSLRRTRLLLPTRTGRSKARPGLCAHPKILPRPSVRTGGARKSPIFWRG